jgi:hypothetical protein
MYEGVPRTEKGVRQFRNAVSAGVVMCWLLNICWCFFVLQIVPQTGAQVPRGAPGGLQWPTLERASEEGQISTVPVVQVWDLCHEL